MSDTILLELAHWPNGGNTTTRYDDGVGGESEIVSSGESYPTWPDPHNVVFPLARIHSKYATYTVSAGGAATKRRIFIIE